MTRRSYSDQLVNPWLLWFGLFGGITAWLLHLAIGFALVYDGCSAGLAGTDLWLWIVTGVLAFVALIATFVAVSTWRTAGRRRRADSAIRVERTYFMGFTGAWLSAFSLLIILMTAIAIFWLAPCG